MCYPGYNGNINYILDEIVVNPHFLMSIGSTGWYVSIIRRLERVRIEGRYRSLSAAVMANSSPAFVINDTSTTD